MSAGQNIVRGSALYRSICLADCPEAEMRELSDAELRALLGTLERAQILSGIPGQIYGLGTVEAARRFMATESRFKGGVPLGCPMRGENDSVQFAGACNGSIEPGEEIGERRVARDAISDRDHGSEVPA